MESSDRVGEDEEHTVTETNGKAAARDAVTEELSHVDAIHKAKELISQLLSDPFLQDLPPDISLDEVKSKLALEQGRAITLNLRRYDDEVIPIIVLQGATVHDLMKAVEKEITRRCVRSGRASHLSWRYVWRTYWLAYGQQRLEDRRSKLARFESASYPDFLTHFFLQPWINVASFPVSTADFSLHVETENEARKNVV